MNTTPAQNDPLMELVTQLDPVRGQTSPFATQHQQEIFDRVAGPDESASPARPATVQPLPSRQKQRRRAVFPGAIAAAIVLLAGAFLFNLSRAPSAAAALAEAVERTEVFDAGKIALAVELREPEPVAAGSFRLDYAFDGADYRLDTVIEDVIITSEMRIDGVDYFGSAFEGGRLVWMENASSPFSNDYLRGLTRSDARPETVLPLIRLAEDFEVDSTGSSDRYRGTISREALLAQPSLPTGIAIVTTGSKPASELPETLALEVVVVDGLISELELVVEGTNPTGEFVSVTVVTTYTEYGVAQALRAPDPADISTEAPALPSAFVVIPDWVPGPTPQTEAERILAEVLARRPGLCFDVGLPVDPSLASPDPANPTNFEKSRANLADCLAYEGEPVAADIVRSALGE